MDFFVILKKKFFLEKHKMNIEYWKIFQIFIVPISFFIMSKILKINKKSKLFYINIIQFQCCFYNRKLSKKKYKKRQVIETNRLSITYNLFKLVVA